MRDQWVDGLLDFHRGPDDYRLRVHALSNLETISGLYFVRPFRPRLIWNYVSQVGPVMVWRKIASRLQERSRNEKCVSIGVGSVLEKPTGSALVVGQMVAFVAPSHPRSVERIVLPAELIVALDDSAKFAPERRPAAPGFYGAREPGAGVVASFAGLERPLRVSTPAIAD